MIVMKIWIQIGGKLVKSLKLKQIFLRITNLKREILIQEEDLKIIKKLLLLKQQTFFHQEISHLRGN